MQLKEMQHVLTQAPDGPKTALDALRQLKACTERALDMLTDGNTVQAQLYTEHGLTNLMRALHYLNVDLEQVVTREKDRQKHQGAPTEDRVILVFSDHAELRVAGELRGTIPLYQPEDYQELRHIAHLFQCRMEHADHLQLDLFSLLKSQQP